MSTRRTRSSETFQFQAVAGNGLLDRRLLLRSGFALAGAAAGTAMTGASAEPLEDASWSRMQGSTSVANEKPSRYEIVSSASSAIRLASRAPNTLARRIRR
jgi:hypothetical protein